MRLCRKLGCGGYKEFQRSLVFELTALTEHQDATLDDITNADSTTQVIEALAAADGHVKCAIVMILNGQTADEARVALDAADGHVREAIKA